MSLYFYGLIADGRPIHFGKIGFPADGSEREDVRTLPCKDIAAVIGESPLLSFEGLAKESLLSMLLAHQETLETIMKDLFVLPCKFGTILKDEEEATQLLSQNNGLFLKWLNQMKDHCEMNVVVTWDPKPILQEIAENDPETMKLKSQFALLSETEQRNQQLAAGARLSAKLKERAKARAEEILKSIQKVGEICAAHDVRDDAMILNASFLIPRTKEEPFFEGIIALDKVYQEKLHFKCIGPLPPYSFACVSLTRFDPEKVKRALVQLGLKENSNVGVVRSAYKSKARECHPDTHPTFDKKEFETINQAYELLTDYYEGGRQAVKVCLINVNGEIP